MNTRESRQKINDKNNQKKAYKKDNLTRILEKIEYFS